MSIKLTYKEPVYVSRIPVSKKESDLVVVDLRDLAMHPEKVQVLFDFLELKQIAGAKANIPLTVSLFWQETPVMELNMKNHNVREEIEKFFALENYTAFHPNDAGFVGLFFDKLSLALSRNKVLKDNQPPPDFKYGIPPRSVPETSRVAFFANPRQFGPLANSLGKKGTAIVFA